MSHAAPNIIVIMTDQQRADLCARRGYALDTTPFMDALAQRGADFPVAYTSAPVCGPARVSLFTGRYPSAHGARTNANIGDARYSADLIDVLRNRGYRIGLSGKNHSHIGQNRWDWCMGFGHDGSGEKEPSSKEKAFDGWLHGLRHMASHEPTPFPLECQYPYRIVSHAQQWVAETSEEPFFLWMSFPEPHNPFQVPEPYYSMFPPETLPPVVADETELPAKEDRWTYVKEQWERVCEDFPKERERTRANYHGMLRLIDDQLKRFVTWLEETGRMENTVIVFASDHGDFVGEYGLIRKGPDLPECLARIPFFVVGPGVEPGERGDAHVNLCDIMPTLCDVAGAAAPYGTQGRSLWPLLTGEGADSQFRSVYAEHGLGGARFNEGDMAAHTVPDEKPLQCTFDCLNNMTQTGVTRMVRMGDWKLIADETGRQQLYDVVADPAELNDRADDPCLQKTLIAMQGELITWTLRMQDPLPKPSGKYRYKTYDPPS
jgi:arylsulfatase A-like enzyme